jgi:hypothetical protein
MNIPPQKTEFHSDSSTYTEERDGRTFTVTTLPDASSRPEIETRTSRPKAASQRHPRQANGTRRDAETDSRWRAACLGDPSDELHKGKPRPQIAKLMQQTIQDRQGRTYAGLIQLIGYALRHADTGVAAMFPGYFADPPKEESTEREIRLRVEVEDLGRAFFSLLLTPDFEWPGDAVANNDAILGEYRRLTAEAEGKSVTDKLNASTRTRARHFREKERRRGRTDDRLNEQMREWLMSKIATNLHPTQPDSIEAVESRVQFESWLDAFPPAERAALIREVTLEPITGEADRKARQRAKSRLRELIETEETAD